MNDIQWLIDRQLGILCQSGYDSVLRRLVVREADSFHGLAAPGADDPPIFACRFAEASGLEHILALANEDGRVAIQNISKSGSESALEGFQCHNNAVFDLAWMPGHMNFVTVSGDHTACLWDVAEGPPKRILVCSSHTRSVKCAAFPPTEPSVFASGARDGNVLLWDVRGGRQPTMVLKPDTLLMSCHSSATPRTPSSHRRPKRDQRAISITGLVFQDDRTLISCGECDGNIKVWDMRKNYTTYTREPLPKHSIPYCGGSAKNGYTNLIVDEARVRLYASCMDNVIYCFNISTYNALPERRYVGHENGTFYIKTGLSPDCNYLVSGSSDKHAYVWNVRCARPVVRLAGHRAEVTCAAWGRGPVLVTCSDDARHMVWRVGSEVDLALSEPELCGRAEPAPRAASPPPPVWRPAGTTPSSRKRPTNSKSKTIDGPAKKKTKRCLADLMEAAREDREDSDNRDDRDKEDEPPAKVLRNAESSSSDTNVCDNDEPAAKRARNSDSDSGGETSTSRSVLSPLSPNAIHKFTSSLPDYVQDGTAPHLRLMSPCKRRQDAPDWLTLMAREKRRKLWDGDNTGTRGEHAGTQHTLPVPHSPKENTPTRRSSVSERTPKSSKKCATLLKYFTIQEKV